MEAIDLLAGGWSTEELLRVFPAVREAAEEDGSEGSCFILASFPCSLTRSGSLKGDLHFFSNGFVCFHGKAFGLETRVTIAATSIKEVRDGLFVERDRSSAELIELPSSASPGSRKEGLTVVTDRGNFRFQGFASEIAEGGARALFREWEAIPSLAEESITSHSSPTRESEPVVRRFSGLIDLSSPPSERAQGDVRHSSGEDLLFGSGSLSKEVRRRKPLVREELSFGFADALSEPEFGTVGGRLVDLRDHWAFVVADLRSREHHRSRMGEERAGGFPLERTDEVVEIVRLGVPLELKGEVWIRLAKGLVEEEAAGEEGKAGESQRPLSGVFSSVSASPTAMKEEAEGSRRQKNMSSDFGYADSVFYRSLLMRYHLALTKGEEETRSLLNEGEEERGKKRDSREGSGRKGEKIDIDIDQIMRDIHRTFPENPFYSTEKGRKSLRNVLVATAAATAPEVGYAQSMNFLGEES